MSNASNSIFGYGNRAIDDSVQRQRRGDALTGQATERPSAQIPQRAITQRSGFSVEQLLLTAVPVPVQGQDHAYFAIREAALAELAKREDEIYRLKSQVEYVHQVYDELWHDREGVQRERDEWRKQYENVKQTLDTIDTLVSKSLYGDKDESMPDSASCLYAIAARLGIEAPTTGTNEPAILTPDTETPDSE